MPALRMVASGLTIPFPAMSGAEPCTGSNIDGKRRCGSRFALAASPMLPMMIAEMSLRISQNRFEPDHDVETLGPPDEVHGRGVHQQGLGLDVGEIGRHFVECAVPQDHAVPLRVRLRDRGDALLLIAAHREFEGEAHDALDAAAGKNGGLDRDFIGLVLVHEAADLRVLALGVLADDDEVDVAAFRFRERRLDSRIEIRRANVRVLIEGAPDRQQQTVERGVIGNLRVPDRAQQDRVAWLEQIDRSRRHHAAPAEEVVGAPVEVLKCEAHIVLPGDALEDAFRLRNDFLADTIAGDHADRKRLHVFDVIVAWRSRRPEESGGTASRRARAARSGVRQSTQPGGDSRLRGRAPIRSEMPSISAALKTHSRCAG